MLKIIGTTIYLTRGDTAYIQITLTDSAGNAYVPAEGDVIRFAVKKLYSDVNVLLEINIPTETLMLTINPADTKKFRFGEYKYDIELTRSDGVVDTFIDRADFFVTEEVE